MFWDKNDKRSKKNKSETLSDSVDKVLKLEMYAAIKFQTWFFFLKHLRSIKWCIKITATELSYIFTFISQKRGGVESVLFY